MKKTQIVSTRHVNPAWNQKVTGRVAEKVVPRGGIRVGAWKEPYRLEIENGRTITKVRQLYTIKKKKLREGTGLGETCDQDYDTSTVE